MEVFHSIVSVYKTYPPSRPNVDDISGRLHMVALLRERIPNAQALSASELMKSLGFLFTEIAITAVLVRN